MSNHENPDIFRYNISQHAGNYCFTLDDNIRFFEESTRDGRRSILTHPYLAMLKQMNEQFHAKFQLNMYFSYEPGGFSLLDVPSCWREELEQNAGWLRFSFHARHNDPPFPYENASASLLLDDYRLVMEQLKRIAGCAATDRSTTLHYVCATEDACIALRKEGVRALIGMFLPVPGREALRYYLTPQQSAFMHINPLWYDSRTDLLFACNDLVLNCVTLDEIIPRLESLPSKQFYQVMIHEQYFYSDYEDYQPDFSQKLASALCWFCQKGLHACFLEDLTSEAN